MSSSSSADAAVTTLPVVPKAAPPRAKLPSHMHYADELTEEVVKSIFTPQKPSFGKTNGNKYISVHSEEHDTSNRVTIVFTKGGWVPGKFGIDAGEYGTYLSCNIADEAERDGARRLDAELLRRGATPGWWPERIEAGKKPPSPDTLEEAYNPFCKRGKAKKNGDGYYQDRVKCGIPLTDADTLKRGVKFVDDKRKNIDYHSVAGKKWDMFAVEIHYIYFKPPMEFGPVKRVKYLRLAKGGASDQDPDFFDELGYLDDEEETEQPQQQQDGEVNPLEATGMTAQVSLKRPAEAEAEVGAEVGAAAPDTPQLHDELMAMLGEQPDDVDASGKKKKRQRR